MSTLNTALTPEMILNHSTVIPVVTLNQPCDAVNIAKTLLAKGITVMEITLRTPAALAGIALVRKEVPEILVGAGTVLNENHLEQIITAGAQFALSPGLTLNLLRAGKEVSISLIPGVSSVSEIMMGLESGYTHFKFFPAEARGGVETLKAFYAPFPQVRFCPTGGINEHNFQNYLKLPNVVCVGGSWVVPAY